MNTGLLLTGKLISWILFLLLPFSLQAQSITGQWKTVDDVTGKPRSIMELIEKNGIVSGKVLKIFYKPNEKEDPVCDKCDPSDPRFNKKVIGMNVIPGLRRNGNYWTGTILDPDNGKVYDCKLWIEKGKLQVRGYILFFYRTQTWLPYE